MEWEFGHTYLVYNACVGRAVTPTAASFLLVCFIPKYKSNTELVCCNIYSDLSSFMYLYVIMIITTMIIVMMMVITTTMTTIIVIVTVTVTVTLLVIGIVLVIVVDVAIVGLVA